MSTENRENTVDLSIIVVPFNNKDLLRTTLSSVYASRTSRSYEVIVHDNGSKDGSIEMVKHEFPQATLIEGENVGFSKGNNAGIKVSKGKYILLLNPDTKVEPDTFEVMLDFMDRHPEVGIGTCKVVLGNGQLDPACRRGFPTPWVAIARLSGLSFVFPKSKFFNRYNMGYLPIDEDYEVDACTGAFLLTRRQVLDKVGLLDEDFFMYNEDVDICYRVKQAGWKVYYFPKTKITHFKRQSSQFSKKAQWEFHRSMALFHKKHFDKKYPWLVNQIAYVGPYIRYALKYFISMLSSKKKF